MQTWAAGSGLHSLCGISFFLSGNLSVTTRQQEVTAPNQELVLHMKTPPAHKPDLTRIKEP